MHSKDKLTGMEKQIGLAQEEHLVFWATVMMAAECSRSHSLAAARRMGTSQTSKVQLWVQLQTE